MHEVSYFEIAVVSFSGEHGVILEGLPFPVMKGGVFLVSFTVLVVVSIETL